MTTFKDIFKSSFIDNIDAVPLLDMVLTIALAFGIGLFIFYVYKKTYRGVMYSSSFGVTLIALTMITSQVILAVTYGDQGTAGYRLPVLVDRRRHHSGRRIYSSCRDRKRDHRPDPALLRQ